MNIGPADPTRGEGGRGALGKRTKGVMVLREKKKRREILNTGQFRNLKEKVILMYISVGFA